MIFGQVHFLLGKTVYIEKDTCLASGAQGWNFLKGPTSATIDKITEPSEEEEVWTFEDWKRRMQKAVIWKCGFAYFPKPGMLQAGDPKYRQQWKPLGTEDRDMENLAFTHLVATKVVQQH